MFKFSILSHLLLLFCVFQILNAKVIGSANRISRQKCKEYSQNVLPTEATCKFVKNSLNSGSVIVKKGDFPHMAVLGYEDNGKISWRCSGVLISDQYVLITAFCSQTQITGPVDKVRLGTLDFSKSNETNMQEIKVVKSIIHPEFKNEKYNDIALLKLEHPVTMNAYVRPVCLPELNQEMPKTYILTGYEIFTEDKKTYLTSYKKVEEVPHQECNGFYETLPHGVDIDTHFCGGPNDFVCKFLSGSPLQTYDKDIPCMIDVHAIVSFGVTCGSKAPTIFTKIAPYIDWIEENVWL